MESIRQYRGLSKEVYVLFLATIINLMGDFIYPFLTLFSFLLLYLEANIGVAIGQIIAGILFAKW